MKLSPRLLTIAEMIDDNSKVVDVGCDHAWLDIYLALHKQNINCIAIDINEQIINDVKEKIKKYQLENKIKTYRANGIKDISIAKEAIIVLAGLGTKTIMEILTNGQNKLTPTLIIQSNNDIPALRKNIIKLGYYIEDEKFIKDPHKDYVIIKFVSGQKKYNQLDYILGPILKKNSVYIKKILNEYIIILSKIPKKYWFKRLKLKYLIYQIKKVIM